jgi:hypothetical protein
VAGEISRVSVATGGGEANQNSLLPAISADGRFVAFQSLAGNLVGGDGNGANDIFVHDRTHQSLYTFIGFNSPLENLPISNSAKAGQTVPIKWQLMDESGNILSDLALIESTKFAAADCDWQDDAYDNPIYDADAAGESGLHYDAVEQQYVFGWKTKKGMADSCKVFILTLADGQQHFARFMIK